MFSIKNLAVSIDHHQILKDINLEIANHEVAALIGPNGSGKTTLFKAIFNYFSVQKTGQIFFNDKEITTLEVDEIAKMGIHLMQQNPEIIPGLKAIDLLQTLVQDQDKTKEMSNFYIKVLKRLKHLELNNDILQRDLNADWSGGEKKKFQALLMELLQPKLLLIDEIDTALDIDALKKVCKLIQEYYENNPDVSIIVISHSNFIFNYLKPSKVYLISNHTIAKTGDFNLIQDVQKNGYAKYQKTEKHVDITDPLKGL